MSFKITEADKRRMVLVFWGWAISGTATLLTVLVAIIWGVAKIGEMF